MVNRKIKSEIKIDSDKHAALYKTVWADDTGATVDYTTWVRVKNDGVYVQNDDGAEFKLIDVTDKANKFTVTGTEYDLDSIKTFKLELDDGKLVFTDYAGDETEIDVESLGFFHYIGEVADRDALPDIVISTTAVNNGDIYTLLDTGEEVYAMGVGTADAHWDTLDATMAVDATVTDSSSNPVESSGIYSFVVDKLVLDYEENF